METVKKKYNLNSVYLKITWMESLGDNHSDGESMILRSLKPKLIENIKLLKKKIDQEDKNQSLLTSSASLASSENISRKPKFYIEGYGCSASFSDMELIAGQLIQNGFDMTNNPIDSTINLIVTCSVKDSTEHRMIHRIKMLSKNNKPIVIAGCLPSADRHLVEKLNPNASLMGPDSINKTIEIVNSTLNGQKVFSLEKSTFEKINLPKLKINPVISIIEIASGCLSECSFCQTKLAKGKLQSYRIGEIIRQINHDLSIGSKEIWLTSTDNGCYGLDINTNLVELLRRCEEIDQEFKIRVGMMNPMYLRNMINDLTNLYLESNKIFKFIHIPVQSGSEEILKKMKRGHTVNTFRKISKQLREQIKDITIATDIITGFPGESEEDFALTLDLLHEIEPDVINSSKYSARPGTTASKLKRIDNETMLDRSKKLHRLIKSITKKRNSRWINWEGEVLLDEIEDGKIKGRNEYYKSIVIENIEEISQNPIGSNSLANSLHKNSKIHQFKQRRSIDLDKNPYYNVDYTNDVNKYLGRTIIAKVTGYSENSLKGIRIT